MIDPLRISFEVRCSVQHAFDTWTERIDAWWPRDHTATNQPGSAIVLEKRIGGRLFERTVDGVEHLWGTVTAWSPPGLFGYSWHIRRDAADATDVEIRFVPVDDRTRVEIVHSGWERLGEGGPHWRDLNQGGWDGVLPHYIAATEGTVS